MLKFNVRKVESFERHGESIDLKQKAKKIKKIRKIKIGRDWHSAEKKYLRIFDSVLRSENFGRSDEKKDIKINDELFEAKSELKVFEVKRFIKDSQSKSEKFITKMTTLVNNNIKLDSKSDGPKFMVITRINSDEGLEKLNPFLLKKCIDAVTREEPISVKKLRSGTILVHTSTLAQAQKLVTLVQIDGSTQVKVSLHPRLNASKGVVWNRDFRYISDIELLDALKNQGVVEIRRMKRRDPLKGEYETGMYFLSFDTQEVPKFIKCGYERCPVREFEPDPQRCFKCLQFGHIQEACRSEIRVCGNCGDEAHVDRQKKEMCNQAKRCVNCQSEDHGSFFKKCPAYIREKEILKIGKSEKVDPFEARRLYRIRFQKETFASILDNSGAKEEGCCRRCGILEKVVLELRQRLDKLPPDKKIKEANVHTMTNGSNSPNEANGRRLQNQKRKEGGKNDREAEHVSVSSSEDEGNRNDLELEDVLMTEEEKAKMIRRVSPLPEPTSKKVKLFGNGKK